jgi:putative toxin-antitoxin system antitoxin component (TIGR02293 family)
MGVGMAIRIYPVGGLAADAADARVDRVTALALAVFGSRERADRWLRRPRREFGGVAPLDMLETAAAARQVEDLLHQLGRERSD